MANYATRSGVFSSCANALLIFAVFRPIDVHCPGFLVNSPNAVIEGFS